MTTTNWVAILAAVTLAAAPIAAQATGDTYAGDAATTDPYLGATASDANAPSTTAAGTADAAPDAVSDVAPDVATNSGRDVLPPIVIDRCIDRVDDGLDKAHRYAAHLKKALRHIELQVTQLELKEMRVRNALDDIVVGEPIDADQVLHLEQLIKRAEHALEGDLSEEREAYLLQVIERAKAALEAGVWTQEDVDKLETQLERIQKLQDKLLKRYLAIQQKLSQLRERYSDWAGNDYGCIGKIVHDERPSVAPDVRPEVRPNDAVSVKPHLSAGDVQKVPVTLAKQVPAARPIAS